MRAREDRQADHVHALLQRRGGDLRGRQADALVDDVHARVARAHGDLLGAVGVPVEARLADEDLRPAPELLLQARRPPRAARRGRASARRRGGLADAGRRAVAAEHLAQRARPLAGRRARARGGDRRDHQVLLGVLRRARPRASSAERRVDGCLVALGAPAAHAPRSARASTAGSTTRMPPSASAVSGESSVSV